MILRNNEIMKLLATNTAVTAIPIPIALVNEVDMAREEHIPSIMTKIGFSFQMPLVNILSFFMFSLLTDNSFDNELWPD